MKDLIKGFFKLEWKLQQNIMFLIKNKYNFLRKLLLITFISSILLTCILVITKTTNIFFLIIVLITLLAFLGINAFNSSIPNLTTISGLISTGLFYSFVVFLFYMFIIYLFPKIHTTLFNNDILFILCTTFVLSFAWAFFSSLANTEISSIVNAIFTVIIGIMLQTNNIIFKFLPDTFTLIELSVEEQKLIEDYGLTTKQFFDNTFSSLLFIPFVMLAFATIMCELKKHWVKKYNNNYDINSELILEPEYEKNLLKYFKISSTKNS